MLQDILIINYLYNIKEIFDRNDRNETERGIISFFFQKNRLC